MKRMNQRAAAVIRLRFGVVVVLCLASGCGVGHLAKFLTVRTYRVPTEAMEPTIKVGDSVRADHAYYASNPVERFDIVIIKAPQPNVEAGESKDTVYVERVIGLGGDEIQIKANKVFINGKAVQEPFKNIPSEEDFGPVRIPAGEFFLMGDNRPNSADSRYWKKPTLGRDSVQAKVIEIIKGQ